MLGRIDERLARAPPGKCYLSRMQIKKILGWAVGGGAGLFVLMQLVPYGRDHANPPVKKEVKWANAETRAVARRACMDCHSNETTWPWYSNIAPISWLVQRDVDKGRKTLNFSDWEADNMGSETMVPAVKKGKMPFPPYLILHPDARLSDADKATLLKGLAIMQDGDDDDDDKGGDAKNEEAHKGIDKADVAH